MANYQKWDYEAMGQCANKLDTLRSESDANKQKMDAAFSTLAAGFQAQTATALLQAYEAHTPSIKMFSEILDSEVNCLRQDTSAMQEADAEIAAQIRSNFGV